MNKLEEILNTRDNSYIRYFFEVGLQYPKKIKKILKNFYFVLKIKLFLKIKTMNKRKR